MRRRATALLLGIATIAAAAAGGPPLAAAQPPVGIVRPDSEAQLSQRELGAELFAANCASCHGGDGRGITAPNGPNQAGNIEGMGPPLRGVGALAADFYLRTGYMPLAKADEQPTRSRPLLHDKEIRALVDYVASLDGGPPIPRPHPERGDVAEGVKLFTEHCAGCHQMVGQGGVVTGAKVPPLEDATATQVAQAVRIGPYLMPKFSQRQISDRELDSIVRYVLSTKHPPDRGGWGIGNLGPFPEGIVTWLLAAVVLVVTCMIIGERLRR